MALTPEEERRLQELESKSRDFSRIAELEQRRALSHTVATPIRPEESEEFKQGRKLPEWAQIGLKAGDVLGMGFPQRVMSPQGRDVVQGAKTQFEEQHPVASAVTTLGSSLVGGLGGANVPVRGAQELTALGRMGRAAITGGTQGAISAAGQSRATTPREYAIDILEGAGTGGLMGGGGAGLGATIGPVMTNVGERVSKNVALNEAQKRLARALRRDAPEGMDFETYVRAQMGELGPEGRMFDVGENTRKLADVLATIPGTARKELRDVVEQRAATRGERLASAAEENLDTQGKRFASTVDDLMRIRQQDASPLYTQAYSLKVTDPSGKLATLVRRADEIGATKIAREIAETDKVTKGMPGWSLDPNKVSSFDYNVSDLDRIKQGLDALIAKQYDAVKGQYTPLGRTYIDLQNKIRQETIRLTSDPKTGKSVYQDALDAFSGPSAMMDAANSGRSALQRTVSAESLRKDLQNMTESEREAFRVGVFEAIRDKVGGSSAGRTEILNLTQNFVPREKLAVIFGSPEKFERFYKTAIAERTMREAESIGRGSQTAGRITEMGELDVSPTLESMSTAGNVATGNIPAALSTGAQMWNRVQLPENTRNQLARLLMQRGPQAENEAFNMMETIRRMNQQRARRAAIIGSAGAGATSQE